MSRYIYVYIVCSVLLAFADPEQEPPRSPEARDLLVIEALSTFAIHVKIDLMSHALFFFSHFLILIKRAFYEKKNNKFFFFQSISIMGHALWIITEI